MSQRTWTAERGRLHAPARPSLHPRVGLHPSGPSGSSDGRTYDELYREAKRRNIKGRSKMTKTELERALGGR